MKTAAAMRTYAPNPESLEGFGNAVTPVSYPTHAPPQSRRNRSGRLRRLATLRLVRECPFPAPENYPGQKVPLLSPQDVYTRMAPYAEREPAEVFWLLALDVRYHLIGGAPEAVTRGILNSSLVHPREVRSGPGFLNN